MPIVTLIEKAVEAAPRIPSFWEIYGPAIIGAAAGLLTGVLAVYAAWRVGFKQIAIQTDQTEIQRKQVGIAEKQTEILSRQIELQALDLKERMFQDRYDYYASVLSYNRLVRSHKVEGEAEVMQEMKFLDDSRRALFIFPKEMEPIIDSIIRVGMEHMDQLPELKSKTPARVQEARTARIAQRVELDKLIQDFIEFAEPHMRLA